MILHVPEILGWLWVAHDIRVRNKAVHRWLNAGALPGWKDHGMWHTTAWAIDTALWRGYIPGLFGRGRKLKRWDIDREVIGYE